MVNGGYSYLGFTEVTCGLPLGYEGTRFLDERKELSAGEQGSW